MNQAFAHDDLSSRVLRNAHCKQQRAPHTRHGKRIKNRVGGFERSRIEEERYIVVQGGLFGERYKFVGDVATRRSRLTERAFRLDERFHEEEQVDSTLYCSMTGCEVPMGGGAVFDLESCTDDNLVLVVVYDKKQQVVSAHYVDYYRALRLERNKR